MPPPPPDSSANTPLAPSVEKAYYRKCIELKRRLNEVEVANDEAKVRRTRLERGITKLRLERAFLLDELKKRMDYNVDDSEGSGEEMMATPPVDRPHRDKRRRHNPLPQTSGPAMPNQLPTTTLPGQPSDPQHMKREFAQPETILPSQRPASRGGGYMPRPEHAAPPSQQPPPPSNLYNQSTPYPTVQTQAQRPMSGGPGSFERRTGAREMDGAADRDLQDSSAVSRQAGAAGEALTAGPIVREGANGERRLASSEEVGGGGREPEGAFTPVNT